jgi:uncharacterized PurR-regulated membrane protein YhhQ (DUF165 family)
MSFETILIVALYVACELIVNTSAAKPVGLPGNIMVPATRFVYALTFTLVDLVNDQLGKRGARHVVRAAFISNVLSAGYIQFAIWFPPAFSYGVEGQVAFASVLGST